MYNILIKTKQEDKKKMKKSNKKMSYRELVEEVQYIASVLNDQPHNHDAYLLELVEAMVEKTKEVWAE